MNECQIRFNHFQNEVVIECQRNEPLGEIIKRYGIENKRNIDEFIFLYGKQSIDPKETFAEVSKEAKEIQVLVFPKNYKENEGQAPKTKRTNYIKSAVSNEPVVIGFTDDYGLFLDDLKNSPKKIKLEDFERTQNVDISKIKCCKCENTMDKTFNQEFY